MQTDRKRQVRPAGGKGNIGKIEIMMNGITRRAALGAMTAPAIIGLARSARADTRTLKISHQFPGSGATTGVTSVKHE
jgi:hypothetical protein